MKKTSLRFFLGASILFFLAGQLSAADLDSELRLGSFLNLLSGSTDKDTSKSSLGLNGPTEYSAYAEHKAAIEFNTYSIGWNLGAIASKQDKFSNNAAWLSSLKISKDFDSGSVELGILSKNLSHIEGLSLLSRSQTSFVHSPSFTRDIGSPSLYTKLFSGSWTWELLFQSDRRPEQFNALNGSIWFPENRITNLSFGNRVLILPTDANFSFLSNRELNDSLLSSISLKAVKSFDSLDLGAYIYYGPSAPNFFYSFTALFTSADQSEITVGPDIGILPTYYKEQNISHFGTLQMENSILRWELGHTKSVDSFKEISLDDSIDETSMQIQWETNQYFGNSSLMHYIVVTHTEAANSTDYKLFPSNLIYFARLSGESALEWNFSLSKSLKFEESYSAKIGSRFTLSDRSILAIDFYRFSSSSKDIVNMYAGKSNVIVSLEALF